MGQMDFETDIVAIVENPESGFQLSRGTAVNHYWGHRNYRGMSFTVISESRAAEPAIFTFTNATVTGEVFPDVEYKVAVSGNAVAENDYYVWYDEWVTHGTELSVRGHEFRLFSGEPYESDIAFEFDEVGTNVPGGTGWDVEPEFVHPEIPSVEIPPQTLVLNEFSPPVNGGRPIIWETLPGTGYEYGLVHLRQFTNFVGLDANWNNGVVTITGHDRYGNDLVISMTSGGTEITVNGQSFDIAEYAGHSQFRGLYTAMNTGEHVYLPFRAIANAYGSTVTRDEATKTVTFHR